MADRTRLTDSDLERLLAEYGAEVAYPPVPDVAAAVEQRLASNGRPQVVGDHAPLHISATPPRNETPPSNDGGAPGVIDMPAPSRPSRQVLEMAAGLLVFAVVAGALALVFGGFDPGSSDETGGAPGSLVEDFDLYVLSSENDQTTAIPLDRDTLANRIDLPLADLGVNQSFFSGNTSIFSRDGSTRVTVDSRSGVQPGAPEALVITVYDGLTNDVRATFRSPVTIATAPRLSDDGSRLVVSGRTTAGGTELAEWLVLDTSDGSVLSSLRIDDYSEGNYELINSDATRLYRSVPAASDPDAGEPSPLQLVGYDLTTGEEFARVTLPEIPAGSWEAGLNEEASDVIYRSESAIAISPDDRQMAVVSADASLVVLLDAGTLEVERRIDLSSDQGRLERLLGWFDLLPQDVMAETLSGPSRHAVFHPEGRFLYSYGVEAANDEGRVRYRGLGLALIDLERGEVAAEALPQEDIIWLAPAPDGKSIYVGSVGKRDGDGPAWMGASPFIIRRLDARTLDVLAEREFEFGGHQQIVFDTTPEPAVDETEGRDTALTLLHVTLAEDEQGLEMLPVNPGTLKPLPGYEPVSLGHHYNHAFSPDGRTMAVFTWPVTGGGSGEGGKLYLIDLVDWTVADTGVEIDMNIGHLQFAGSEDGQAVYWTLPTSRHLANSISRVRDYKLYRYSLETGAQETVVSFPEAFVPYEHRIFRDGTRLAVWGVSIAEDNITQGPLQVIIVDLERDEIVANVEAPGVRLQETEEVDGELVYRRSLWPGLAWDLDRERLYVAHADEDRISVIDLREGTLTTQSDITRPRSMFDQFIDWLAPSAAAKGGPSTTKLAVLSEDGSRLYVAGKDEAYIESEDGESSRFGATGGTDLVIVDTESIEEVDRLDLGTVVGMQPTTDRKHLLVRSYESAADTTGHRLIKLDMATGEVVAELALPDQPGLSMAVNGQTASVRIRIDIGETTHDEEVVIDLESFEIVEQRNVDGWVSSYLRPAG